MDQNSDYVAVCRYMFIHMFIYCIFFLYFRFKFAWFEYPIVSEMTYTAMGRARRMVNGFMSDFMEGWQEDRAKEQYRIGSKAAEITADDYFDYQSSRINAFYSPNRRVNEFIENSSESILVKKVDPKLSGVVEMLKNLQPKEKSNITSEPFNYSHKLSMASSAKNNSGDEIKIAFRDHRSVQVERLSTYFVPPPLSQQRLEVNKKTPSLSYNTEETPVTKPVYKIKRIGNSPFPKFEDLPPADYSYVKNGVHHHIHDLRKNKSPRPSKKGEWLSFDFEDAILSVMGLSHPGRSVKHSAAKCSKIYIFQVILRFVQTALVG